MVLDPTKHDACLLNGLIKNIPQKHVSLECEQRSIQDKQAMPISTLYIKNCNEECFNLAVSFLYTLRFIGDLRAWRNGK